jgi:hypothetical protein
MGATSDLLGSRRRPPFVASAVRFQRLQAVVFIAITTTSGAREMDHRPGARATVVELLSESRERGITAERDKGSGCIRGLSSF